MREKSSAITNKSVEMIKWLSSHNEIQRIICREGYDAELPEYLDIIEELGKQGYYELIYILLVKNQYNVAIDDVVERLLFETLTDQWEKTGNEALCTDIKERIKAEMEMHSFIKSSADVPKN